MTGVASLVALDTATRIASVAVGDGRGMISALRSWDAGFRHGEELLPVLDAVFLEAGVSPDDVEAFVVGTGPGGFTGLRVGLATAKGLAYALGRPIVGVSSAAALAFAAFVLQPSDSSDTREIAVLTPAGLHDRYVARYRLHGRDVGPQVVAAPRLVPRGEPLGIPGDGGTIVPVDLSVDDGFASDVVDLGRQAQRQLGSALLALGRMALDRGEADDVAALVPVYVTLPRGAAMSDEEIAWSRGHR